MARSTTPRARKHRRVSAPLEEELAVLLGMLQDIRKLASSIDRVEEFARGLLKVGREVRKEEVAAEVTLLQRRRAHQA